MTDNMSVAGYAIDDEQSFHDARGTRNATRRVGADTMAILYDMLAVWDFVGISVAGYLCLTGYTYWIARTPSAELHDNIGRIALLGGVLAAIVLRDKALRPEDHLHISVNGMARIVRKVALLAFVMLGIGFLTHILDSISRMWVLAWIATALCTAIAGRMLLVPITRAALSRGIVADRVAIVGSGPEARRLAHHIEQSRAGQAIHVVGVFDEDEQGTSPWHGSFRRLMELGREGSIDRVVLALSTTSDSTITRIVEKLKALDVEASFCPSVYGLSDLSLSVGRMAGAPLVLLSPRPIRRWGMVAKSVMDRGLAGAAVVVLAPLLALIAVAIRLDSDGPVIFRQQRHGRNNTVFDVLKFRTMTHGPTEPTGALRQTSRNDSRITRVGAILRKTSLDELAQLFNVLSGTMSLVGPRPHAVVMRTEELLGEEITSQYPQRHQVRPGITGWAQINGYRGATNTVADVRERVAHDLYYINNWSLLFDLKIVLLTPYKILFARDNAF